MTTHQGGMRRGNEIDAPLSFPRFFARFYLEELTYPLAKRTRV